MVSWRVAVRQGSLSPGPVYYPSMAQSKTRPAAYSMGSGHTLGDATTVVSPGPVYDTRERPVCNSVLVVSLRMIRHLIARRDGREAEVRWLLGFLRTNLVVLRQHAKYLKNMHPHELKSSSKSSLLVVNFAFEI